MRKVHTSTIMVLVIGIIFLFAVFAVNRFDFIRKSKPLSLLPLVQKETILTEDVSKAQAVDLLQIKEAEISLVNNQNRLTWELVIQDMVEDEEKKYYLLSTVHGRYFPVTGEAFRLQAKAGRMTKDFSQLELFGEVTISRSDLTLTALEASWSAESGKIIFKNKACLQREGVRVRAEVMQADPDLEQIEVEGKSQWRFNEQAH